MHEIARKSIVEAQLGKEGEDRREEEKGKEGEPTFRRQKRRESCPSFTFLPILPAFARNIGCAVGVIAVDSAISRLISVIGLVITRSRSRSAFLRSTVGALSTVRTVHNNLSISTLALLLDIHLFLNALLGRSRLVVVIVSSNVLSALWLAATLASGLGGVGGGRFVGFG
jgi:hypothetical protein